MSFVLEIHPALMHGVVGLAKSLILSLFVLLMFSVYLVQVDFLVILISLYSLNKTDVFHGLLSASFGYYFIMIILGSL